MDRWFQVNGIVSIILFISISIDIYCEMSNFLEYIGEIHLFTGVGLTLLVISAIAQQMVLSVRAYSSTKLK